MAGIRLEWAQFGDFDSFDVLRSEAPMDINALPSPIATNLPTMYYVDTTVVEGATYYYRVVAWRDGVSKVSGEIQVKAPLVDPHWDKVVALLHFDGPDGSTDLTDQTGRAWMVSGTSTIQGGELVANGGSASGACTTTADSGLSFGSGDFTVEFFATFNSLSFSPHLVLLHDGSWGNRCNLWLFAGNLRWYREIGGSPTDLVNTAWSPTTGVRHHLAVVRAAGTTRLFADGVDVGSASDAVVYPNVNAITLGSVLPMSSGTGDILNGRIDELRITKGVARYTDNFTPPDAPFPSY